MGSISSQLGTALQVQVAAGASPLNFPTLKLENLSKEEFVRLLDDSHAGQTAARMNVDLGLGKLRPGETIFDRLLSLRSTGEIIEAIEKAAESKNRDVLSLKEELDNIRKFLSDKKTVKLVGFIKSDSRYSNTSYAVLEARKILGVRPGENGVLRGIELLERIDEWNTEDFKVKNIGKIRFRDELSRLGVDPNRDFVEIYSMFRATHKHLWHVESESEIKFLERSRAAQVGIVGLFREKTPPSFALEAESLVLLCTDEKTKEFKEGLCKSVLAITKEFLEAARPYGFDVKKRDTLGYLFRKAVAEPQVLLDLTKMLNTPAIKKAFAELTIDFPEALPFRTVEDFIGVSRYSGVKDLIESLYQFNIAATGDISTKEPLSLEPLKKILGFFGKSGENIELSLPNLNGVPLLKIIEDPNFPVFVDKYLLDKAKLKLDPPVEGKITSLAEIAEVVELFSRWIVHQNLNNIRSTSAKHISDDMLGSWVAQSKFIKKFEDAHIPSNKLALPPPYGESYVNGYLLFSEDEIRNGPIIIDENSAYGPKLVSALFQSKSEGGWGFDQATPHAIVTIFKNPTLREFYISKENIARYHAFNENFKIDSPEAKGPNILLRPEEIQ